MSKLGLNRGLKRFKTGKRGLMVKLLKDATDEFAANFKHEGGRFKSGSMRRSKWAALKKPRKDGSTTPVLTETGALKSNVLRINVGRGNEGRVLHQSDYAEYHNDGNPETNLPQRQFAGESEALLRKAERRINAYIKQKLR